MARTALTQTVMNGAYGTEKTLTWEAADVTNGNQFTYTGKDIILAHNNGVSEATLTVASVECSHGRIEDLQIVLSADELVVLPYFNNSSGWMQTDGKIYLDASSADVKLILLRTP